LDAFITILRNGLELALKGRGLGLARALGRMADTGIAARLIMAQIGSGARISIESKLKTRS
jgi:hypothetical protein